jgi:hypothetical protein
MYCKFWFNTSDERFNFRFIEVQLATLRGARRPRRHRGRLKLVTAQPNLNHHLNRFPLSLNQGEA